MSTRSSAVFSPDGAAQQGHHHGGHETPLDLGIADLRPRARDGEVTGGDQPGAAGQRPPLHYGHDRLGGAAYPGEQRAQPQRRGLVLGRSELGRRQQLLEVGTGAEVAPRPTQHDHPDLGVEVGAVQRRVKCVHQCRAQRVALVGAVEGEREDPLVAAAPERPGRGRHGRTSRRASAIGTGISIRSRAVE